MPSVRWRGGSLRAAKPITVEQAWEAWHQGARAGAVTNRSGDPYKPSALRSYERGMRLRVLPEFGCVRLAELHRPDLQEFADRLLADGRNPSTIQVTLLPLRAMFRRALARGELAANPCNGLQLPAVRGRRERYATPTEAETLIAAVPPADQPVWATAMYAGLRRGELQALRAEDVDLASGVIRVEFGWEYRDGQIPLKSNAGRRKVPIPAVLRKFLAAGCRVWLQQRRPSVRSCFAQEPVRSGQAHKRADRAWSAAGLERITLHECRHTFASLMIAAGVNPKALQSFMGHANISITLDRYGHLMPGSEARGSGPARRLRQPTQARQVGRSGGSLAPEGADWRINWRMKTAG